MINEQVRLISASFVIVMTALFALLAFDSYNRVKIAEVNAKVILETGREY